MKKTFFSILCYFFFFFKSMSSNTLSINSELPSTNFFTYNGKVYPFNVIIFNQYSKFFLESPPQINSSIKLIEDSENCFDLPDASIKDFINYCQCKSIILTKENILPIHYLAKKFMVHSLMEKTEQYISDHKENFLIQFLNTIANQQDIDTNQYEEIISRNILDYIRDDQLLSLSFPMLYRIVTKYQLKIKDNEQQPPEMIEFLFKCLDHFGITASSLFEHVNLGEVKSEIIYRLLTKYSHKFDFHFINSNLLKTFYQLQNELIQKDALHSKLVETVELQKEQISELKKQIDDLNKQPITVHYLHTDNQDGIVALLGDSVKLSAGGYHNRDYPVTNLTKYNDIFFYNYYNKSTTKNDYQICKSEDDSYIEFDFGAKKIDLFSYFIRTHAYIAKWYHAKSWRIVGSNDRDKWQLLDLKIDSEALHGASKESHFICTQSKYGNINNRYRYIRYIQTDTWHDNRYNVYMVYFELYGDIYD